MEIKILASGSSGNAYYVSDETSLLLEAGIPFRLIQQGLNFKVSQLAGCLISHEHQDHAKAVKDMMRAGVDCFMSKGTAEALALTGHRVHIIEALRQFKIGTWKILPFRAVHDAAEPLGFLMANQTGAKLLYATDTEYIAHRFTDLTHILVECNYSMEIAREKLAVGELDRTLRHRILKSHLALETIMDFLKENDKIKVESKYLLHLSDSNSNAELFKRKIQELTGKIVKIA